MAGKRANFVNIQMSQFVPVEGAQIARVRTSFEKTIPLMVGYPFAYYATDDGTVVEDDEDLKIIKIEYKNGKRYQFQYGEVISKYSSAGMNITQSVVKHSMLGKKFKKNDPLVYNNQFFGEDPWDGHLSMLLGKRGKVCLIDKEMTQEDGNIISQSFAEGAKFRPVHERQVVLSTYNSIVKFADVGAHVNYLTPLVTFEEEETELDFKDSEYDEETIDLLNRLNRQTPRADHHGIIKKIEVYYRKPLKEMSSSMAKFIKHVQTTDNAVAKLTEDAENSRVKPDAIPEMEKIGYIDTDEDTVVIKFFIQDEYGMGNGDKAAIYSSLKTVTSTVMQSDVTTADGKHKIDMSYAGIGFFGRIVWSPIITGCTSITLEELQDQILEEYRSIKK